MILQVVSHHVENWVLSPIYMAFNKNQGYASLDKICPHIAFKNQEIDIRNEFNLSLL